MSRYPPIAPKDLSGERKEIHDTCYKMASDMFGDKFVWKTSSDALVGPFTPLLYVPLPVAQHFLGIASAIGQIPDFPPKSRETAILATGSHFGAVYEIYAHERVAEKTTELSRAQIKTITAGQKPLDLDEQSSAAFDVAIALSKGGGSLGDALFEKAKQHFGLVGAQALIQYVGVYAYTCILLNGSAVPVPVGEKLM